MRPINLTLYFIFLLFFIFLNGCNAEKSRKTYAIAQEHLHFRDLNQSNYLISAEIFYPCESNNTIVNSKFPLIIFAHGYQQAYGDYRYLWEALVAQGYILAFLTTQGGLSIDIDSYSNDILSLRNELMNTSNTIIAGHITKKSALMGHSTGGGAIYLAEDKSPQSATLVSLAALGEPYSPIYGTSPITVASNINASTLILSGDKDCITPLELHQKPLYDAFKGEKNMIIFEGGDHCGFSDSFNCPVAESLSCGLFFQGVTISETKQHSLVLQALIPWLDKYLKN